MKTFITILTSLTLCAFPFTTFLATSAAAVAVDDHQLSPTNHLRHGSRRLVQAQKYKVTGTIIVEAPNVLQESLTYTVSEKNVTEGEPIKGTMSEEDITLSYTVTISDVDEKGDATAHLDVDVPQFGECSFDEVVTLENKDDGEMWQSAAGEEYHTCKPLFGFIGDVSIYGQITVKRRGRNRLDSN